MMSRMLDFVFWRGAFYALMAAFAVATFNRFYYGLGASTNLSDEFPWGIWVGFDILCGVGLAAGGFTLAATVHIFHLKKYEPIVRPAILTAFLGYLLVIFALMFDLGKPWNVWHPIIMWNPKSVMFEVGWCVTLYTTVLFLEFLPAVLERFQLVRALRVMKMVSIPVVVAGVLLSTLHQSSLGSLYLIVPNKLYALWYTPVLPVLFFISAICVGLAMTIFESWHSARAFGRALELPLLQGMARVLAVLLAFYLGIKGSDLTHRHAWGLLTVPRFETYMFWAEILLMAVPMLLLFSGRIRSSATSLYVCALMVIFGFLANRLNVGLTGMEAASGVTYIPKWTEVAVTLGIVALGFALFTFIARRVPVFEEEPNVIEMLERTKEGRAEVVAAR